MVSLADAFCLLVDEGVDASRLKRERLKKKIRRDSEKHNWPKSFSLSLGSEWRWRICTARLCLGALDWNDWELRYPRNGMIPFDYAPWDGKPVKRLLVYGEQGLGDEVMFSQCIPEIPAEVTFECEPRLATLFARSFGIETIPRKDLRDSEWTRGRTFDAQIALGDLVKLYRTDRKQFTSNRYLKADPQLVEKYSDLKGIGLSWKGRQGGFNPEDVGGNVNLQYDANCPNWLVNPDCDLKNDIESVFAIIENLDKVISAPTSVVHFAGALGKRVDVILPKIGINHGGFEPLQNNALNWRFHLKHNNGRMMIWHPTVRIYESLIEWQESNSSKV